MKKLLVFLFAFASSLLILVFLVIRVYEDHFVSAFKNQIIEKSSINLNFSNIHFSAIKNFPYGSFILDDAQIFYSKENTKDTLLSSKKISFKINLLNIFRDIYEFPEIIVSDGVLDLENEKLDLFFPEQGKNIKQEKSLLIETRKIILKRCWVKYRYKETIKIKFYLENSSASGTFLTNALSLRLNLNIQRLIGNINKYEFNTQNTFKVTSTIKKKDDVYFSDDGLISYKTLPLGFSFIYSLNSDVLKISSKGKHVSAKVFNKEFLSSLNLGSLQGTLSYESSYSIDFNKLSSQRLALNYELNNLTFTKYKDFSLKRLKGKTVLTGDFSKNNSEIESFKIDISGVAIEGESKVKNLPHPYILVDCFFKKLKDSDSSNRFSITGDFSGKLKLFFKINDLKNIRIDSLDIKKVNADINFVKLTFKQFDFIEKLTGNILINDNDFHFIGSGQLLKTNFNGSLSFSNLKDVLFHKVLPHPNISINMNRLNLDSMLTITKKSNNSINRYNYNVRGNIQTMLYKGVYFNSLDFILKCNNNNYQCDQFSLNAFQGKITGSYFYSRAKGNSMSLLTERVNIHDVFRCFNNFEQNTITYDNISGSLSGGIALSFKQLDSGKLDYMSIKSSSDLVVENGKLSGISELKKVFKFLKINEFDTIHFKTLQNRIDIEQGKIKIPTMEVASNAINFRLTGQHGFDGEYTYWIKVNLREILAKKYLLNKVYNSEYERDSKNGLNIYLKLTGTNSSFDVSFDKKSSLEQFKGGLNKEGLLLKNILKEEFGKSIKDISSPKDSIILSPSNKFDSIHNKKEKKPFRIEWDEIDSTKIF